MCDEVDVIIIGAGVIGLAVACSVADDKKKVYVLEQHSSFGQETSSRNSQVIHAGLYYPKGSLKAKTCVEGNRILYQLCASNGIPYKKLTKVIVATTDFEVDKLDTLLKQGEENGVEGLHLLSRRELAEIEPEVKAVTALHVPSTGIIDVHGLMKYYLGVARSHGAEVVYKSKVTKIKKVDGGYAVTVCDSAGDFVFFTRIVINCAGLHADEAAKMAGIDVIEAGYRLHYCKGEYFSVRGAEGLVKRLVYPVPLPEATGLGVHVTIDLDGRVRLGPDAAYIPELDYKVDGRNKGIFYEGVRRFLPRIQLSDLEPEMAGIRPKLQGPGERQRDFVLHHEQDKGLAGLINLIGIESPGITASPAIANMVRDIVKDIL